jgi:hypothetical protein
MRAHIIKDGIVENTIEVESLDFMIGLIAGENGGAIGDTWDGEAFISPAVPEPEPPTILERFTTLKTYFVTYIMGHYDLGTQGTIQMAYTNEDSSPELKAKAKAVGDWILTVQAYYKEKKLALLGGDLSTTWDFQQFDTTKPIWDFEDFV